MRCPSCKPNDTMTPWEGTVKVMGVEVTSRGSRCSSCAELLFSAQEMQDQERAVAAALVKRGVRSAKEFKFVRKVAGLRANELAELLDVRPETVSRWERGEVEIPRTVAFALGEMFERPRATKEKLTLLAQ